jgi:ribosomal protein S18 acetylase RimI-like enzyme
MDILRKGVAGIFSHPERGFYIVVETGGAVVAGLLVTYEWSDWRNALFWWIQSVYVRPDSRRIGVYRAMHDYVAAKAAERGGVCGVRLYVDKDNHLAQQVYAGLGMRQARYEMFEVEFEERSGNQ